MDQGNRPIALTRVSGDGNCLTATVAQADITVTAELAADGDMLIGQMKQGAVTLPLSLRRRTVGTPAPVPLSFKRPQTPIPPFPYRNEEVSFAGKGGMIAGTLTTPPGKPRAAVLLIAGSGRQTRDEDVAGHKPFLVLADHLARHNIAVLRTDKRGVGKSTGDYDAATTADFADDAADAIAWLRQRADVDPANIGLIGHSEGGYIAPMLAAKDPRIAFVVLMAAPALKGRDMLELQQEVLARHSGVQDADIQKASRRFRRAVAALEGTVDAAAAQAAVTAVLVTDGMPQAAAQAQARTMAKPWFSFMLHHDPSSFLARVRCPVLAINGEKDLQVPPRENLAVTRAALAGHPDADIRELPGLNHMFQAAPTGLPGEYGQIEQTMAPLALDMIADWIVRRSL